MERTLFVWDDAPGDDAPEDEREPEDERDPEDERLPSEEPAKETNSMCIKSTNKDLQLWMMYLGLCDLC